MSYILDALKKSEQQRQEQNQQSSAQTNWLTTQQNAKRSASLIPGLLIGIATSLILVMIIWQIGFTSQPEATPTIANPTRADNVVAEQESVKKQAEPKVTTVANITTAPRATTAPVRKIEKTKEIKPVIAPALAVADTTTTKTSADKNRMDKDDVDTSESPQTEKPAPPSGVRRSERHLPPLTLLRTVPDLIITGHIYSTLAEKRSVSMNGREWHEGDYISDTIRLKEITPDGILVDVDGWDLPVKRNAGWHAIP